MQKSLVLAMAMALGVTASAYAANPFSDVPAGHWAYDSVNKLAEAGVVEGYPDGTYGGSKLMTRYEMAQIVAKAMAKGADVDKLAAEFAEELDSLGVRVANLEEKSDNVKITGEIRYRYADSHAEGYTNDLRSRLWVSGQVNDDWNYVGMIENTQDFGNDNGDEKTSFKRAYVQGRLGGFDVTAGRYNLFVANGNIYDTDADGAQVTYGDKVQITGFVGKGTDFELEDEKGSYGNYAGAELNAALGKNMNLLGGYVNFKDMYTTDQKTGIDNNIWYAGAAYNVGDVTLDGMYLKGDMKNLKGEKATTDNDGYVLGISYKGAQADEAGSWGLWAKYYNQGGQTYVAGAHTTDANTFGIDGFKGYGVAANYAFAKNIVGTVAYYDTESKMDSKKDDQIIWSDLTFLF